MKKSSKKIPKTHLPKYSPGGTTSQFSDEVQYDSMYTSGMGDRYATNNSGNNMYNDRRASKIKSQEQAQQTGQYVAAASAGVDGGINMMNTYKNPDATIAEGWNAGADTGANIVGSFGPWGQVLGMGIKATNKGGDALRTGFFEKANADGSLKNPRLAEAAAFTNTVANPLTWGSMINKGIYTPRQYRDTVEQENKDRIASQGQMFPMGGMNMQPNAEVELEENTLNPDGTATQYDGASHEQGGIKTNLDPGTLIFSDKVKWDGKTAADHNKPYTRIIQKATKDLENSSLTKESKLSAHLNLMAATKASQAIFAKQEETKQSRIDSYTKRLGGIMKYPNGGLTPQQYKQAQTDSMTLYNSGLKSNIPNFEQNNNYTDAFLRLNDLNKKPPVPTNNVDPYSRTTTATYIKPTMLPYREENFKKGSGIEKIENYAKPVGKPVNHPSYNQFIPGINQSKQPIQTKKFKKGGVKGNTYTPRVQDANDSEDIVVPGTRPASKDFTDVLAPDQYNTFGKPLDNWEAARLNKSAWDADYMNNPSAPNPNVTNPDSKNFDWKGLATQSAYFAANNAGNIYDLARANKTETRKYNRATENLVTPNFRDADQKYLYMKNALKGASLGASGYLANLQQAHVNNVLNKAQIQQAADNTNAGIKNQVSQYNTGIANEEILANAKIRANARSTKQSAIASMGSNSANQMNDVRNTEMDQKKLDGLIKMYPALSKDPEMLKYFMSFHK